MEVVHPEGREKGPLVALVLALIVLGLGSLYLTWQSIAQQRKIVEDHMVMTGNSILRGVDNNIFRIARTLRMGGQSSALFRTMTEELFTELAKSEDIEFVTLFDRAGHPIVTSVKKDNHPIFQLPDAVAEDIEPGRAWHVMAEVDKTSVLLSGLQVRAGIASLLGVEPEAGSQERGQGRNGMGRGMGPNMGSNMGSNMGPGMMFDDDAQSRVYLVVGLNAEKHMRQFRQYRQAATYQTGYVFLAAVVLWSLAFAYLRRRGASRKLVRLERFQNKLLDNMPDGLVTLAEDGEILAANRSALELLSPVPQAEPDDGPGPEAAPEAGDKAETAKRDKGGKKGADKPVPPEIVGANWRDFDFGRQTSETPPSGPVDWEQFDYQGRQLEILFLPFLEHDEDEAPEQAQRLVLIRDRTEIRSLEEDLNEAKRLAAIGSLAAGVAHEVRNPLSSLRGFAQLFATKLKGQAPLDQYAAAMVQEADRLNRVVTDLLYLAKPRRLDPMFIDMFKAGDSLRQLMRFDFEDKQIEPEFDFGPEPVWADPDALRQVLLNLISNSLDALRGCADCDKPSHVRLVSMRGHKGTWIIVADNGPGMDPEIRDDVFKPFVTGKKTGTGLGLAIVQNIMRAHKGRVIIESEPGRGTEMKLFFPDPLPTADKE
ncbi:integral membrane sensor signal transduction histidine kinase [Pseudodesulfovibrio mercurii]|uniref:histidine kinase n=1 Tax=Pseudodesulfovibrio mercurii TaxID=641491 RepID=F0JFF4_9BACT|nr:ATP-binding protein [Pseudodesulfovibrio mercurii]EGB14878.1 integral membrane sensor signal transduction histidine kinase [Pseudodesulfovibrio mercurii]